MSSAKTAPAHTQEADVAIDTAAITNAVNTATRRDASTSADTTDNATATIADDLAATIKAVITTATTEITVIAVAAIETASALTTALGSNYRDSQRRVWGCEPYRLYGCYSDPYTLSWRRMELAIKATGKCDSGRIKLRSVICGSDAASSRKG